jgi:hypothetical protein
MTAYRYYPKKLQKPLVASVVSTERWCDEYVNLKRLPKTVLTSSVYGVRNPLTRPSILFHHVKSSWYYEHRYLFNMCVSFLIFISCKW